MFPFFFNKAKPNKPHAFGIFDNEREDYLIYVIAENVATEEEKNEYRALKRDKVLAVWNEFCEQKNTAKKEREMQIQRDIAYHEKILLRFKELGHDQYAEKRQLYIDHKLKEIVSVDEYQKSLKKFPGDWGDHLLDSK